MFDVILKGRLSSGEWSTVGQMWKLRNQLEAY